jgi:predicted O-methyltransferase YrrM
MDHFGPMIDTHGAVVIKGDSHDRATLDVLRAGLGGRPVDVLFIDGDHTAEGLRSDWLMYSPLVRPGGLVLIHDIRCAGEEPVREVWETEIKPEADATGSHTQEIYAKTGKPLGFGIVRMAGER